MDLVVSAITGDLVKRFISFLIKKYESQDNLERKMERLQDLLLTVHMIVEEAEGRCISNSKMLLQFKKILELMYQGYHVLDIINHRTLHDSLPAEEVSSFNTLSTTTSYVNPFRAAWSTTITHDQLQSTLDSLETLVSSMTQFVFLLRGYKRLPRKPYDTYLYFENFMFGRQVEKQQVINILLQDNLPHFAPIVLPIIGPSRVGKKTLVAHVCNNEMVRSHFSSILHLNGENIRKMEWEAFAQRKALFVVEFTADIDDEHWNKFYVYVSSTHMGRGNKIIIISRIDRISRFGTVRAIHLNSLSPEEYSYFFKVLAFGSTNPEQHPQLVSIANEVSALLGGSFLSANVCANVYRRNQNVHFWLHLLKKQRNMVHKNISVFKEHPKLLFEKEHQVDITIFSPSSSRLRLMPFSCEDVRLRRELSKVPFEDLIVDPFLLPKEDFELFWESRIPPYRRLLFIASYHDDEKNFPHTASPCKKRRKLDK